MRLVENLQADLIKKLSERTIEKFAKGVEKYFKESGYLDNLNTTISNIYMTRWTKFIVEYMNKHHIPLVKIDIGKLAVAVGEYLMKHCRRMKKCDGKGFCDTCYYLPESDCEYCDCYHGRHDCHSYCR